MTDFMLCESEKPENLEKYRNEENWYASRKYDGSRVKIVIDNGIEKMMTRHGEEISDKFPEFRNIEVEGEWVLDGEVCLFENGKSEFNKLLYRTNQESEFKIEILSEKYSCKLVVFDVLEKNGKDLRGEILKNRVGELDKFMDKVKKGREHFIRPKQYSNPLHLWEKVEAEDLEGIVLKDLNSKYEGKRSKSWRKVKNWSELKTEANSYEEHNKGILIYTKEGYKVNVNGHLSNKIKEMIDNEGKVFIEVNYLEKTKNNNIRHPHIKRLIK